MSNYEANEIMDALLDWTKKKLSFVLNPTDLEEAQKRHGAALNVIEGLEKLNLTVPENIKEEEKSSALKLNASKKSTEDLRKFSKELVSLAKEIESQFPRARKKRKSQETRATPKKLHISFPDGTVFCERIASDTFVKTLQKIGLEKLSQMPSMTLVSTEENKGALNERNVDGYFVQTHSNTAQKAKKIKQIAEKLQIDISVKLLEK